MTTTEEERPIRRHRSRAVQLALVAAIAALLVLLLAGVAMSRFPMWGAELFGALAKKIKGNPGATTAISLCSGAVLWLVLGLLAAGQEWLAARRKVP